MVRDLKDNNICVNLVRSVRNSRNSRGMGGESGEFCFIRWNFTAFPATGQASET